MPQSRIARTGIQNVERQCHADIQMRGDKPTKHRPSTDQVFALVKVLNERELSVKEIMEVLELNHRPTFRTNYLHPALNEGYIVPLYPDQPSHPKQKYRLTEKGMELLKQQ